MMNGTYTAVLDRIVDGTDAVLLLEEEGETVDEVVLDIEELPAVGQHERAIFDVTLRNGAVTEANYRPEEEQKRLEDARRWREQTAMSLDELNPEDIERK